MCRHFKQEYLQSRAYIYLSLSSTFYSPDRYSILTIKYQDTCAYIWILHPRIILTDFRSYLFFEVAYGIAVKVSKFPRVPRTPLKMQEKVMNVVSLSLHSG